MKQLRELLEQVKAGQANVDQALERLRRLPFEDIGDASVDHHRAIRCGQPEVIYCPGKTTEQIVEIFDRLAQSGNNVLATRTDQATYNAVKTACPTADFEEKARAIVLKQENQESSDGFIAIVTAGTSDIPVAEEARVTAELQGQQTKTVYDAGVAGLHRLLARAEVIQQANVVVVVAGMEGALASVVGGLVAVPVIAVPTSIGYGTGAGGFAALLSMLNSCASGVSVVNIDNGFAAGTIAARINRRGKSK